MRFIPFITITVILTNVGSNIFIQKEISLILVSVNSYPKPYVAFS